MKIQIKDCPFGREEFSEILDEILARPLKLKINISSVRQAQAFGSLGTESSGRTSEAQARRDDADHIEASSSGRTLSVPISPAQRGGGSK